MKKILISCVNYNTYDYLDDYLKSIDVAAEAVKEYASVTVAVADNTEKDYQDIIPSCTNVEVKVFLYHKNYGYMGGAVQVLKDLGENYVKALDYVIVSNVDIQLDASFFLDLLSYDYTDVGWIAPSVFRLRNNNSNENPFQRKKPSMLKMDAIISLYKFPFVFRMYELFCGVKNSMKAQINKNINETPYPIYAGIGAIFVFTKQMIGKAYPLDFPCFMYGEELYYGYLVERHGLKTVFYPKIKVNDICNVSTSKLGNTRRCKMNYDSLRKLRKIIYSLDL